MESWYNRALHITPGGAQTLSKRPAGLPANYPRVLDRGDGAWVEDVPGKRYLDLTAGLACISLGYKNPIVDYHVETQLKIHGVSFSLPHWREIEVAERLVKLIPCAGQIRFVKTGSEACAGAVRMARMAYNHRDRLPENHSSVVIAIGYHGWHDWYAATRPSCPGVPGILRSLTWPCPYNDLHSLKELFRSPGTYPISAVILEPTLIDPPHSGYLSDLIHLAHEHGAFVIFDEMVCGFRWAVGGGQEYFEVTPDLAVFGKGIANGFPLACIVGRAGLMEHAWVVSGTFGGEALSLAACFGTLEVFESESVIPHIWAMGKQLQDGLNQIFDNYDLPLRCEGYPVHPVVRGDIQGNPSDGLALEALETVFFQEWVSRGVLMHPKGGNIMYAVKKLDIEFALNMAQAAVEGLLPTWKDGRIREMVLGGPRSPHPLGR